MLGGRAGVQVPHSPLTGVSFKVIGSRQKTQDKKLILACYEAVKDIGGNCSNHLPIYAKYLCQ